MECWVSQSNESVVTDTNNPEEPRPAIKKSENQPEKTAGTYSVLTFFSLFGWSVSLHVSRQLTMSRLEVQARNGSGIQLKHSPYSVSDMLARADHSVGGTVSTKPF
jgi:hypothetical protein